MQRTIIDKKTNKVVNVIELPDGWSGNRKGDALPPKDHLFGPPGGKIGDDWIDGEYVDTRPVPPAGPRFVSALAIAERLNAAGQLAAFDREITQGAPLAAHRWWRTPAYAADDPEIRALIAAAGADPDVILG